MHRFRHLVPKLSYANVMSTVAVVLVVGGGATALALSLPKNSVSSKQLAKGAVKTPDIAKDAVTGDKAKESTLGKVPLAAHADTAGTADTATSAANAAHAGIADSLGGTITPASLAQVQNVSGSFGPSGLLELKVQGFGRYYLYCKPSNVVTFNYSSSLGANQAIESGIVVANEEPYDLPPEISPIADYTSDAASAEFVTQGRRLYVHYTSAIVGSTKTLEIDGGGFDDASPGCVGQLHASVSG
jgi:hypothetical protein